MLVALLVAACVAPAAADWVEISQQYYRKPTGYAPARPSFYPADDTRSHNHPDHIRLSTQNPVRDTPTRIEDESLLGIRPDEDRVIYSNHSISEHNWNQNKHRVPGNIRRVDTDSLKVKANVTPEFSLEIYGEVTESAPESVMKNVLKDRETASATVERVSNKGSVKRVHLSNTPVKSHIVQNAINPTKTNVVRQPGLTAMVGGFSDDFDIKSDIFKNEQEDVIAMTPSYHEKHVFSGIKQSPVTDYNSIIASTDWPTSKPSIPFQRYPQTQYSHNSQTIKETDVSYTKNITVAKQNPFPSTNIKTTALQTKHIFANENKIAQKIHNFITTTERNKEPGDNDFEEITTNGDLKNKKNFNNNTIHLYAQIPKSQNTKQNSDANSNGEKNNHEQIKANAGKNKINEEIRVNTMENVMKFMKVVADTISKNTRRGVGGKVKYLNDLKQTLLRSIHERIEATWPDDTSAGVRRLSRPARDTARGHVELPSSESALMTISFLTFAVFLIKLVLQVIHTYKNKAMMVAPLVVASAGRTVRKLRDFH